MGYYYLFYNLTCSKRLLLIKNVRAIQYYNSIGEVTAAYIYWSKILYTSSRNYHEASIVEIYLENRISLFCSTMEAKIFWKLLLCEFIHKRKNNERIYKLSLCLKSFRSSRIKSKICTQKREKKLKNLIICIYIYGSLIKDQDMITL